MLRWTLLIVWLVLMSYSIGCGGPSKGCKCVAPGNRHYGCVCVDCDCNPRSRCHSECGCKNTGKLTSEERQKKLEEIKKDIERLEKSFE